MVLKDTADNTVEKRRISVRAMCSNVNEHDLPTDELDRFMGQADTAVETRTNKSDWTSTDKDWKNVINASNHFAAATFWGNISNATATSTSQHHITQAKELIKNINRKGEDQGTPKSIVVYTPDYRTEPLSGRED